MIRSVALALEPLIFKAISPLMSGSKARYGRSFLAQKYCKGRGAEIGAGVQPIMVPGGSKTLYVDAVPASFWRAKQQWADQAVREPDIIDQGATLSTIEDDTFDYLIAAHVLEHIEDPIGAIKNWVRVVKSGGHVVIAVPDMRLCGEAHRPLTTIEHFVRDHEDGPHSSASEHYDEMGLNPDGLTGAKLAAHIEQHEMMIHWHTFTLTSFVTLLARLEPFGFELVEASLNVNEDVAVLRKL